jgi:hypothetical protein
VKRFLTEITLIDNFTIKTLLAIKRQMNDIPIIIDVEASGFGAGSYPIEVGIAMPEGSDYCRLIRPEPSWTRWDEDTEKVHGITREILQSHGKPITEVAEQLNDILGNKVVYSDGWGYDQTWLRLLYHHAGTEQQFQLEPLTAIMSDHQMRMWERTKWGVIREFNLKRHRASSDAKILQLTYLRSLETKLRLI